MASFSYARRRRDSKAVVSAEMIDGIDLTQLFDCRENETVYTLIPEYKYEFGEELNTFCQTLGIRKAFTPDADFTPMVIEQLIIDQIMHKAFIQVDRNGTKAAAVTTACGFGCAPLDYKEVELKRPFLFAIMHNETRLPIFVGIVSHLDNNNDASE